MAAWNEDALVSVLACFMISGTRARVGDMVDEVEAATLGSGMI
jgi:hypothetical protein